MIVSRAELVGPDMSLIPLDRLLKLASDRIFLAVKVSPKSHRDAIKGIVDLPHGRIGLAIGVRPPASDGAANEAVIGLLADLFGVSRSSVEIKSGATGRAKIISIEGVPSVLQARLCNALELHQLARESGS
jgi:uncharacterized protein (TIGR00251 family)